MALSGVATRFWSPAAEPAPVAGRIPGTTMKSPGAAPRAASISCDEQTRPAMPAFAAMRARARTISGIVASIPSARRSSCARLVKTVTPRIFTWPSAACAARDSISNPPEVCTVSSSASIRRADCTARATVSGMSCSLRSRKIRPPRLRTASTARSPSATNSSSPTL